MSPACHIQYGTHGFLYMWTMNTLNCRSREKHRFEMLFLHDCKKGDTYSWPFHSCARVSSGCKTCVRPDRRTAPVPWTRRGASPSGSPSAWSSYISPLEPRTQARQKEKKRLESCQKGNRLSVKSSWTTTKKKRKSVTDRNVHTCHVIIQQIWIVFPQNSIWALTQNSSLIIHLQEHTAMQSKCIGYACHCRQGFACLVGGKEREGR